jgi:hypothetical protein
MSDASVGCTVRLFPRLIIRNQASSRGKGLLWEKTVRNNFNDRFCHTQWGTLCVSTNAKPRPPRRAELTSTLNTRFLEGNL